MNKPTEAGFMATVVAVAHQHGWKVLHIRAVQRHNGAFETPIQYDGMGWPDLFMTREKTGHVIAAELKVGNNKETPEQEAWLHALECCGVPSFTWWPTDWEEIETALRDGAQSRWQEKSAKSILDVIQVLATSDAVTDTIWMPGQCSPTAVEELAEVAARCGATVDQIEMACAGKRHGEQNQAAV